MSYLVYIIRWAWRPRDIDVCLLVTAEEGPWKRALCWLWADSSLDKICWRSGGCRASKLLEDVANDHQALLAQGRIQWLYSQHQIMIIFTTRTQHCIIHICLLVCRCCVCVRVLQSCLRNSSVRISCNRMRILIGNHAIWWVLTSIHGDKI